MAPSECQAEIVGCYDAVDGHTDISLAGERVIYITRIGIAVSFRSHEAM